MTQKSPPKLELEYRLDAPPEKVWRAISIPTLRQQWLPDNLLATAEPLSATPNQELRLRMAQKAEFYQLLTDRLVAALAISPSDVMVTVQFNSLDDWCFAEGKIASA